mmetsp:Transcript_31353/g.51430  ORF Transcript_31353/g.51430 Transcript_31353/m.51430 type:complete len:96 (-) Transcript_31353:589-876(-)
MLFKMIFVLVVFAAVGWHNLRAVIESHDAVTQRCQVSTSCRGPNTANNTTLWACHEFANDGMQERHFLCFSALKLVQRFGCTCCGLACKLFMMML